MINLKDIHSMDFIRCFPGYGRKERMKTIDIYNGKIELRVVRQNFDEFKWGVYCNKNSYIYIYSSRRIRESREILIIVLFVYNVTRANQDTRALTRVRYILECAWWKKKKKGRTPSAKHLLRPPLLNDFTHCASKYQPLVFRGSLCRDNSNIKATIVNVTGIYIIIHPKFHFHLFTYVSHIYARSFREKFWRIQLRYMRNTFNLFA